MKSLWHFEVVFLLAAVSLTPAIEQRRLHEDLPTEGNRVVSSLDLHVPLAADRVRASEKPWQDRSAVLQFRLESPGLSRCTGYRGPLVTSRERAILDLLMPTLRSGKICLQV
jgi:hypothetical protein